MRKGLKALAFLLMGISIVVVPTQASADSSCFADIPDSAWAGGIPSEVTAKLNYDLVQKIEDPLLVFSGDWLTKSKLGPYSAYDRGISYRNLYYLLSGNSYTVKYSYSGKTCTTRVVEASKSFTAKPDLFSFSDIDFITKTNSNDYLEYQEKSKIVSELQKYLNNKTISIPVNSKWLSSETWAGSKRVKSQYDLFYISDQMQKLWGSNPNEGTAFKMYMKPDPVCVAFSETRNVPNFPKQFRLTGQNVVNPWATALKFTKKNSKPCKVSFYLEVVPLNPRTLASANYLGPKSDDGYKLSVGFEFASGYLKAIR